jgi:hypothetical protein
MELKELKFLTPVLPTQGKQDILVESILTWGQPM